MKASVGNNLFLVFMKPLREELLSGVGDTVVPPGGRESLGQLVLAEVVGGGHLVAHPGAGVPVLGDQLLHGGGLGGAVVPGGGGVAPG